MGKDPNRSSQYYCEYCNAWMADHPQVRANHENGVKHKAAVARRLNDMRKRSENEERERAATERAMVGIEAAARKQYEADKAAEEAAQKARIGTWEYHAGSGYYYNAAQRWYYDLKSKMYYGGDPADWTADPPVPAAARFDPPAAPAAARPAPAAAAPAAARTTTAKPPQTVLPGSKIVAAHPLAGVGGYQMPSVGRIGGAKGVGVVVGGTGGGSAGDAGKRKRGEEGSGGAKGGGKPMSKEEAEFLARREAARQRVQKRTMNTFGLG